MEQFMKIMLEQIGLTEDKVKQLEPILGHFPGQSEAALFAGVASKRLFINEEFNDFVKLNLQPVSEGGVSPISQTTAGSLDLNGIEQPEDLGQIAQQLLAHPEVVFFLQESNKQSRVHFIDKLSDNGRSVIVWVDQYVTKNPTVSILIAIAQASREIVLKGGIPVQAGILLLTSQPEKMTEGHAALASILNSDEMKLFGLQDVRPLVGIAENNQIGFALIGTVSNHSKSISNAFQTKGDLIFILGESPEDLSGSIYLNTILGKADGSAPLFDVQKELQVQGVLDGLIQQGLINAAHGCGRGGVYAALLALSLNSDLGFDIVTDSEIREDAFLFGESPNRAIVTVSEDQEGDFIEFMMNSALPFTLLGHVTKGKLMVDEEHYGFVHEVAEVLARKNN
jgi:phosphoribosylformylglycinamidine synthase subunit PurL